MSDENIRQIIGAIIGWSVGIVLLLAFNKLFNK